MGVDVKSWAKTVAAGAVHYTGLRRAMCAARRMRAGGRRITIVSYHRVVDDFAREVRRSIPGLLISQATFRKHLEDAHAAGYEFASLGDALDVMAGRRSARRNLLVVTFDDGYRDVFRFGAPVLKQMGVPAIVYLPVGFVSTQRRFNHDRLFHLVAICRARRLQPMYEAMPLAAASLLGPILSGEKSPSVALDDFIAEQPAAVLGQVIEALERQLGGGEDLLPIQGDVMDWDEARQLVRDGFELGAHTIDHTVLTLEARDRVEHEVRESKARIEAETGFTVRDFAYCNGWYSDVVIGALVRNGFRSAVTTEDLPNIIGGDPFTLKRKVLWENFSVPVGGGYSKALTTCQIDDVFGFFGMTTPVLGRRPHGRGALPARGG